MPYIIIIIFLAVAFALQILTGNIPLSFLAFPLNLILALIWAVAMVIIWKTRRKSIFVEFMLSRGATVTAIVLFIHFAEITGQAAEQFRIQHRIVTAKKLCNTATAGGCTVIALHIPQQL